MNAVDVSDLAKSYGPTRLLDGVSFTVGEAEKVGLVGRNGCGKSTLFRILAGLEEPDGGRIARRRGLTVGYLPQRPSLDPDATVRQVLEGHLGEARERLARHQALGEALRSVRGNEAERLLAEQHEVHAWLDHHGAWTLGHRVDEICTRLAIADPEARVGTLSGGWSQRVALAGMLLGQPDLLLLDEPTNQLDADTVEWLEGHLAGYPGAVLLVTHDRYFLDRVVARMLELEAGRLTAYAGGYSAYLEQKAERLAQEDRTQDRLLNLLRREEAWLARGPKARSTKQKARIDRAEELKGQVGRDRQRELALSFEARGRLGGTILEAEGLTVAAGGRELVRNLTITLRKGERIGILGPNGCGKTSLVRALLGELAPAGGSVTLGRNTRVGYLDQARSGLDEAQRVDEAVGEGDWVTVGGERRHKAGYLEQFLFSRLDQQKPISTLSGGERARLLLARLLLLGANVLVLDEPTNDLDIPTLQVLDEALAEFAGCLLMVTHDRYFLDRVATGILHFEGQGRVVFYEGNYEMFSRLRAQRRDREREAERAAAPRPAPRAEPRAKAKAGLTYRERQELTEVEAEIEGLETRKAEIEAALADPSGLGGGHRELQELSAEFTALETRLEARMARWEELEGKR
ncbi:MAG: ABC-F family ATP-binding cassette domain-containing protein [Deferrisomatales bacterium]